MIPVIILTVCIIYKTHLQVTNLDGCAVVTAFCFAKACTPRDVRYWKTDSQSFKHDTNTGICA